MSWQTSTIREKMLVSFNSEIANDRPSYGNGHVVYSPSCTLNGILGRKPWLELSELMFCGKNSKGQLMGILRFACATADRRGMVNSGSLSSLLLASAIAEHRETLIG